VYPQNTNLTATILSGPLILPNDANVRILDLTGRSIASDKMKAGIYFIEVDGEIQQKVIKIR
jgi:hypothetical protein